MTASFIFDLSAALSAEGDLRRLLVFAGWCSSLEFFCAVTAGEQ
jgi:hypothetical protein